MKLLRRVNACTVVAFFLYLTVFFTISLTLSRTMGLWIHTLRIA